MFVEFMIVIVLW